MQDFPDEMGAAPQRVLVLDASAVLAILQSEPGAEVVAARLSEPTAAHMSAVNWSEVLQKLRQRGHEQVGQSLRMMLAMISVQHVTQADAEAAAALWQPGTGLSLADRLCIALGQRLNAEILTADQAWSGIPNVTVIR